MKITDRFVGDHKTFLKMFKDIDLLAQAEAPDNRRLVRLVELFVDHLLLHAWGEETFYYPAVGQKGAGHPIFNLGYMTLLDEEHAVVDRWARRLEDEVKKESPDPHWKTSYAEFKKGLLAHMKKEEEELFPLSEQLLGTQALHDISSELERRRKEAPAIRRHSSA